MENWWRGQWKQQVLLKSLSKMEQESRSCCPLFLQRSLKKTPTEITYPAVVVERVENSSPKVKNTWHSFSWWTSPKVPDFNKMYELHDPCNIMFFYRNKHIMIDLRTVRKQQQDRLGHDWWAGVSKIERVLGSHEESFEFNLLSLWNVLLLDLLSNWQKESSSPLWKNTLSTASRVGRIITNTGMTLNPPYSGVSHRREQQKLPGTNTLVAKYPPLHK